ncbi:hypothetical protein ACGFIW_00240 [Micromonospora sp. NPDC048935]
MEVLDVALCHGRIDGQRTTLDDLPVLRARTPESRAKVLARGAARLTG